MDDSYDEEDLSLGSELVHLDLSQNKITHIGARYLFEAVRINQTLISLNLGNDDPRNAKQRNSIGPKGAKYLKEMLIENKFMSFLNIMGNGICDQGVYQIALGLKQNHTLETLNIA